MNINIQHRARTKNIVSDFLSRYPKGIENSQMAQRHALPDAVLYSLHQPIEIQRKNPSFNKISNYFELSDRISICGSKLYAIWFRELGLAFFSQISNFQWYIHGNFYKNFSQLKTFFPLENIRGTSYWTASQFQTLTGIVMFQ